MGRDRNVAPTRRPTAWVGGALLPYEKQRTAWVGDKRLRDLSQRCDRAHRTPLPPVGGNGPAGKPWSRGWPSRAKARISERIPVRLRSGQASASVGMTDWMRLGRRRGEGSSLGGGELGGMGCDGSPRGRGSHRRLCRLRRLETCATRNGERSLSQRSADRDGGHCVA